MCVAAACAPAASTTTTHCAPLVNTTMLAIISKGSSNTLCMRACVSGFILLLLPAEHFVAFLMNYQDPQSGRNTYIDQLVR